MITVKRLLSRTALELAQGIIGSNWHCFSGGFSSSSLDSSEFIIETDRAFFAITAPETYLDFEGVSLPYSNLEIERLVDRPQVRTSIQPCMWQQSGQQVREVRILRTSVVEAKGGQLRWKLESDDAVSFIFDSGTITFSKADYQTPFLRGILSTSVPEISEVEPAHMWVDSLEERYEQTSHWITASSSLTRGDAT